MILHNGAQAVFSVDRISQPMMASFHSYFKYKKCKFLIFGCSWSDQYNKVWWSWAFPPEDVPLWIGTYNISV